MENNWNQLIERYLNNELSAEGREAFESELAKNQSLQQELELHQLTQDLIRRTAVRNIVVKRGKFFKAKKIATSAGIVVIIVAAITTAVLLLNNSTSNKAETESEQVDKVLLEKMEEELGFENLDVQYFKFTGEDDIFLSESGVLLSITDNSFLLNGKPYHGEAVVQWQEAQTAAEIVKAGLSTTSGYKLLETQGMFSLNAFTPEGKKLDLSDKGIYVQVPVAEHKEGMMLFNGVKGNDGNIDWQNPQQMEKLPVPKSMAEMDLFPPKYEPKLNELKWFTDKAKRDSLYLSFDETEGLGMNQAVIKPIPPKDSSAADTYNNSAEIVPKINTNVSKIPWSQWSTDQIYLGVSGEQAQDKVDWTFSVDKIEGTNEAWVIANVRIQENWKINALEMTVNSFGVPSKFQLNDSPDYEIIGEPIEPHPIITYDQQVDENLCYHQGIVKFKQRIRIKNKSANIKGKFGYQTCDTAHCLPPYQATFLLPIQEKTSSKSHIPPSKVLAIWNTKFDNTILATVDFEKRMKAIHNTCDSRVFDIYVNGMNESLWKLDEKVVKLGYPQFQQFADEHIGRLNLSNEHQQNLNRFYSEAIKDIRAKGKTAVQRDLQEKQDWDNTMIKERNQESYRKGMREMMNLQEERAINLNSVYLQMGMTRAFTINRQTFPPTPTSFNDSKQTHVSPKRKYVAPRASTGPFRLNIDSQVANATVVRKTSYIKDYHTGKTAKLVYQTVVANVKDFAKYNRLFLYLFSKETKSYQRLDFQNGKLSYSLNGEMNYNAVVVGMNENGYYIHEINTLKGGTIGQLELKEVSETEFDQQLNAINSSGREGVMEIQSELNWLFKEKANYKVLKQRQENALFRAIVEPTIYSCLHNNDSGFAEPSQETILDLVDEDASFPGGASALYNYLNANLVYPQRALDEGISGRVYLRFMISETGQISDVRVTRGIKACPECDAEAKRMVENMPNWIPARNGGKAVSSWYNLPIKFKADGGTLMN